MEGHVIRERFLAFFEARDHTRVRSSSLIPPPGSGLLLTNAGMNQFIPYFLGQADAPYVRAVTSQKVMRTNDIENVGHDARHLTFFEMLGNFSFADYFKAEAIAWAHELVTEGYGIEHDRLWVTVYEDDEESVAAWIDLAGIAPERIVRRGKVDADGDLANYWHTHTAGPGGPCSEIFVDRGVRFGPEGGPDVDEERFVEIWNLVFMQDQVDDDLEVVAPLPGRNVDTGSSLERVAMVLQDVDNVFETDLFRPMLEVAEELSGRRHGTDPDDDVSLKILAEHGRATAFLIADGVLPTNAGRGYVLKRMLRRAVSHARRLAITGPVLDPVITTVIEGFGDAYPELRENEAFIRQVATSEEEGFSGTLGKGLVLFEEAKGRAREGGSPVTTPSRCPTRSASPGSRSRNGPPRPAWRSTWNASRCSLRSNGNARARPGRRSRWVWRPAPRRPPSSSATRSRRADSPLAMVLGQDNEQLEEAQEGQEVRLFLERTPFYAEGGGQIGDQGTVRTDTGLVRVVDTLPAGGHAIVHVGTVESGEIRPGQEAHAAIDRDRREATARSHTSTHVIHWTLKQVLGEHARQAGSLVAPGRLRFDFHHPSAVPMETLEAAELEANRRLAMDDTVRAFETSMGEAKALGAVALFGEKYGDVVRVVEIGDYSRELCGGTHVHHTGHVAVVRILHEGSIGAGMRRVEALVGPDALREINAERALLRGLVEAIGSNDPHAALDHARRVIEENKRLKGELGRLRAGDRDAAVTALVDGATPVDGVALVVSEVPGEDPGGLRELAQKIRDQLSGGPAAVVVGNGEGGKAMLVAAVTAPAVDGGSPPPRCSRPRPA